MLNRHAAFFYVFKLGKTTKNVRSLFTRQKMGKVLR
jgi:hypothetical protein